jgi:hypothetical protein
MEQLRTQDRSADDQEVGEGDPTHAARQSALSVPGGEIRWRDQDAAETPASRRNDRAGALSNSGRDEPDFLHVFARLGLAK